MKGDFHVRFCGRRWVKFPLPTRRVPCERVKWLSHVNCKLHGRLVSRNRFAGEGCKPVYAAGNGNVLVVNDTFKRQFQLSGGNIGDDRKGTVDETSKSD